LEFRFNISPSNNEDKEGIRKLLSITWFEAYNFISEDDILIHLENFYSHEKLDALFDNENYQCYSVKSQNNLIGWMKLFNDKLSGKFFISSLYVLPSFQGNGIGSELIKLAEEKALQLNYREIWIGVMKSNLRALNWYKNLGYNFLIEEPFVMGKTNVSQFIGFKKLNNLNKNS